MKKVLFSLLASSLSLPAYSQWVTKNVDNHIDDPYKIAYCSGTNQGLLKLENVGGELAFYVSGSYICEDYPVVDIGFVIGTESKKYSIKAYTSSDSHTVFIIDNLLDENNSEMLNDFKKCSSVVMRINESHCEDEYYTFNMSGSTRAVEFMSNLN